MLDIAPFADAEEVRWSKPAYAKIAAVVGTRAGLTFPENRREITEAALCRAMAHTGEANPDRFAQRVEREPDTYASALTELTVGETYFFRDPAQWELIRAHVVPELLRAHPDGRGIRAWSAGCASGEEAYTLGIVLREAGCVEPSITGTDLCEHRLARASRAVYTKWSMRGVEEPARRRHFTSIGQYFHLLPEFRDVAFRPLNLASAAYGSAGQELSELDLILCRNVLIYIEPEVTTAIFARLVSTLRPGGWLMVAASDPQPESALPLDVLLTEAGLLYRKRDAEAPAVEAPQPNLESTPGWRPPSSVPARATVPSEPPHTRTPVRAPAPAVADARAAYLRSDYVAAIERANHEIASGNDTVGTWVMLTRSYANMGRLGDAAAACTRAIDRHPATAELYILESTLAAQRNHYAAAADSARRALYVDRSLAAAHVALGTALLRGNDPAAADRAFRAAERLLAGAAPSAVVQATDSISAGALLATVRAHRALLAEGGLRAG
ncbi:MAG: protein-glutamate O-methyltransferase CheR [Gemmatimonadota bacterium]|nr:protein-glutamate O-methyltransferase CheR [Gemmatimonadota bacterium]